MPVKPNHLLGIVQQGASQRFRRHNLHCRTKLKKLGAGLFQRVKFQQHHAIMCPMQIPTKEVQVWVADLDMAPGWLASRAHCLSEDERTRAARLLEGPVRSRFVAGRLILRHLLGRYLAVAPEQVGFVYGAQGKPALAAPDSSPPLAFNLAHSQALAVYAFAADTVLGVDVEQARELADMPAIARQVFSPQEWQTWQALPAAQKAAAFYLGWTRKEAYIKALGLGFSYPLQRLSVALTPGAPARLLGFAAPQEASRPWTLWPFEPAPSAYAALVVAGVGWSFCLSSWTAE